MSTARKVAHVAAAVGASLALTLTMTGPASAAARDGICDVGEFCLYYFAGQEGSVSDFTGSIPSYGATQPSCYEFKSEGGGKGQCVKNNARSAWNLTGRTVRVYFDSNYGGSYDEFPPSSYKDLVNTFDENASHRVF